MSTDTTDVQTVEAVFFENRLFLRCSFAGNSQARGCIVRLTLSSTNETESFEVSRESGSLCTTANNQRDAYSTMVVLDLEANGMEGNVSLNFNSTLLTSQEEYIHVTGCREGTSISTTILIPQSNSPSYCNIHQLKLIYLLYDTCDLIINTVELMITHL